VSISSTRSAKLVHGNQFQLRCRQHPEILIQICKSGGAARRRINSIVAALSFSFLCTTLTKHRDRFSGHLRSSITQLKTLLKVFGSVLSYRAASNSLAIATFLCMSLTNSCHKSKIFGKKSREAWPILQVRFKAQCGVELAKKDNTRTVSQCISFRTRPPYMFEVPSRWPAYSSQEMRGFVDSWMVDVKFGLEFVRSHGVSLQSGDISGSEMTFGRLYRFM